MLFLVLKVVLGVSLMAAEPVAPRQLQQNIAHHGSAKQGAMSDIVQESMRVKNASYAVLETEDFFPEDMMRRFYGGIFGTEAASPLFKEMGRDGSLLQQLSPEQMAPIQEFVAFLTGVLNRGLRGEEQVEPASVEVRFTRAGGTGLKVGPWHADDNYLVASVAFMGPGTQYFAGAQGLVATPRGRTLVMSGKDRAAEHANTVATMHRAPTHQDRFYLVVRFGAKHARPFEGFLPVGMAK